MAGSLIYTSLDLGRQLRSMDLGGFRLLANLLAIQRLDGEISCLCCRVRSLVNPNSRRVRPGVGEQQVVPVGSCGQSCCGGRFLEVVGRHQPEGIGAGPRPGQIDRSSSPFLLLRFPARPMTPRVARRYTRGAQRDEPHSSERVPRRRPLDATSPTASGRTTGDLDVDASEVRRFVGEQECDDAGDLGGCSVSPEGDRRDHLLGDLVGLVGEVRAVGGRLGRELRQFCKLNTKRFSLRKPTSKL